MKIQISLSQKSIDDAIRQLNDYSKLLQTRIDTLCERLAERGVQIASVEFGSALYDGTNDVTVGMEEDGDKMVIRARGNAVAFIEFGTGVKNASHPMQNEVPGIVAHGQYGHGLGKLESWRYPEEHGPGTNGVPDPKHPGYIITHGNPANMPMYNTSKQLRQELEQIAREVFQS